MPDYAKALKVLHERAAALRGQISAMTEELEAVLTAQKAIAEAAENAPKPKPRSVTTLVLSTPDLSRKPN
jgi:hypothetical protein